MIFLFLLFHFHLPSWLSFEKKKKKVRLRWWWRGGGVNLKESILQHHLLLLLLLLPLAHQPPPVPPSSTSTSTTQSIRQPPAGLADSGLISHKLVFPLTLFSLFVSGSCSFHSPHALSRLPSLPGPHISFFFLQMPHSSPLRNVISVFFFCSVISPCPSFSPGNSFIALSSAVPVSLISLSPSSLSHLSLRLCL